MKPKNKRQQRIFELSQQLPPISDAAQHWAIKHTLDHKGFRTGKGVTCLDCGYNCGVVKVNEFTCPNCGVKLSVSTTRRVKDWQKSAFAVLTTKEGFQVIRISGVSGYYRAGEPATITTRELAQFWIDDRGKFETVSLQRFCMGNVETWSGQMEMRHASLGHYDLGWDCVGNTYPRMTVLPILKRNGFTGDFHGLSSLTFFTSILSLPRAETLLKSGQISLFKDFTARTSGIDMFWPSIRICMRTGYIVPYVDVWLDYLTLLREYGKDLLNPKYVCPKDLMREHDRYVERRRKEQEAYNAEEKRRKIMEDEAEFRQKKALFFGLVFTNGEIEIKPLESVRDVADEGDAMHHCVFTSKYYEREDSLILSARLNGRRLATIEFQLSTGQVVQCRGLQNSIPEHNDIIIDMINKNKHLILKRQAI